MQQRMRKRSRAITLVLAGSAALAGCESPVEQRDAYASLADCTRDWENPAQCEPVRDGRYASSYFYGPRYFGSAYPDGRPRPSPHAMDAVPLARSSTSSGSRSWFSSGSSSRSWSSSSTSSRSSSSSGSTSRGGFGSSGRSASSSGS